MTDAGHPSIEISADAPETVRRQAGGRGVKKSRLAFATSKPTRLPAFSVPQKKGYS